MDGLMRRRFFAEEIEILANLRTPALVDAFAAVPRERFLRPGPWLVHADSDFGFGRPARLTVDADPGRVSHNVAVAIDPSRDLFNASPSVVASFIDALALRPGDHVLHVGCGLGYYSAVMAQCVGARGRVVAIEVDAALAAEARANLASMAWVDAREGTGVELGAESFDAILVNAGMSHPHESWLRALRPGGRIGVLLVSRRDVLYLEPRMIDSASGVAPAEALRIARFEAAAECVAVRAAVAVASPESLVAVAVDAVTRIRKIAPVPRVVEPAIASVAEAGVIRAALEVLRVAAARRGIDPRRASWRGDSHDEQQQQRRQITRCLSHR